MNFFPTTIPSVVRIEPNVFADSRGYFLEVSRADHLSAAGIPGVMFRKTILDRINTSFEACIIRFATLKENSLAGSLEKYSTWP